MKANFNIAKNVRNSRSISALQALKKLQGLGLVALFLLIGSLQVWGESASITFADLGLENGVQYPDPFDIGTSTGVTITFAGGDNDGKYYNTGSGIRTYGGGTITVDAGSGTLTEIVYTFSANGNAAPSGVSDVGTYSLPSGAVGTWTGSASSVTLTRASGSGHWRLQSVSVTYTPAASGYTVDFAVSPAGYGTVSPSAQLTGVASGTAITKSGNSVTIGETTVTATPHASDATYNYAFNNWTVTDNLTSVTKNVTVTANFTRSARSFTNYRTLCSTTDPSLSVTESLTDLGYIYGNSPVAQSFSFTGSNLESGTITVTAPTNFEVCKTANGTYTSSITFTGVSGTLASTAVYVRLASGKDPGEYSGNVSISGCGLASAVNVAVVGTVVAPTITVEPTSVTWNTQIGVTAETRSVTVTGINLKANISAALDGGDASSFSISPNSLTQTSGSASGTITITYTGSTAATTTKTTTLYLTSTDATTKEVTINFSVIEDPREKFMLLTNASNLTAGAKVILVYKYDSDGTHYRAMKNYTGTKGSDAVEEGATEFEVSGTNIYLEEGHHVQVLDVGESGAYFSLSTGSAYLQNSADKSLTTTTTSPLPDAAKWAITIDGGDNTAAITSQGATGQDIRYNAGQAITAQPFRCYASSTGQDIYIYYQPSSTPSVAVDPASLSGFTYVVNNGPSSPAKTFAVSGMNLTGTLTVALTSGSDSYEISKTSATTGFGSSVTFTGLNGTLNPQTIWVRLKSGLSVGSKSGTITVSGAGVAVGNNKTVSLTGSVTNAFHTVTISAGSHGSVSPSGSQSVEEGGTLTVTPTADTGYEFSGWTVTGTGSTCVGTTFTMGTVNATLTANFSQIMVSSITVSGDATVKTSTSKTYTATVSPDGALTKTVTWSVINGTGTATINSSGVLTAGSPGTVTVRATATDGSGVYGELAVTVQDVVRYKFVKMTSTPSPWVDDDYLIVNEGSSTILSGSDPVNKATGTAGEGNTTAVTITGGNTITLEDNKDDAFHISYVDTKGYLVQGVGGDNLYVVRAGTATGGSSVKELASNNSTDTRYWYSIAYNKLTYSSGDHLGYNSASYRFYTSTSSDNLVLYRLETAYTITCNTPTNGTLSSNMGSAASGTTITLTVTPNSNYELDALTITKAGGGTVTPTKVTETSYTFTMPADNVTVTATFKAAVSHTLHFNVPSCVTAPSDITGKATGSTATMPSEPAGTPDGYTFVGWALAEQLSPVSVQPTTIAPGSYTVPSGAATLQYYALYSEGGVSVGSGTFNYTKEASSGLTTLVNLTSDDYYILSSTGNNAAVVSNTISGTRVGYTSCTGAGESTATISTAEGVYLLHKTGDYYTLKNLQTGQYLASNGNASQATMMDDDGTNDHVKWSIVSTQKGYKLANKYNTDNSVNAYLGFSAGNGYGCYAASNTTITMFFYKAASGAVTVNATYTTNPDCYCDYRLMQSTNSGSTWSEVGCFTKVKPNDASDHEWQLANFTMPAHNSSTLLKVQKNGADLSGQTGSWQSGWIPLAELQGEVCTYKAFELQGAVGTLRIFDNDGGNSVDANSNFYLGFYPTYQITHGVDGGGAWANESFELVDAETHKYQTAVTTAPAGYFADNNYKFYIGARKSDGTTKYASKNDGGAQDKSNTQKMNTMGGMTSDVGGRSGVYQMYSNSCDQNWYCTFIPYYVVYYYDVNGNEIEEWRDVLTSPTTTVHGYGTGQTGWATTLGGAANPTYNAGASITPSDDVRLYQVASTYTVTYSVASETSAYNGTTQKVIQGQAITLPTITFSCARYPSFVGWVSGDAIVASDPEEKTEIPSTFVGAGGDSYIPTGNVTLRALYGHNCDGDAGWQKQTTISAGKYIIVAGTYGFAGLESAVTSTTNQGSYLSGVTVTDNTVASSTGMHEVDVILGANGTFAIQYSSGQYMENSSGYFNGNVTSLASAYRWKMNASGQIYDASATTMFLQINNSNHKFKCYAGTQTTYANLYKYIKTGYYTTNPTCTVPTTFTLSFDGNKPDGAAGEVSDVPSNIVRSFSPFPTLATAIDLDADITNPTLTGWKLTSWNTAANGSGTTYALDAVISEFTGNSLTLYAQWERVYTVRLFDNGVERTPLVQESAGATVTLPSGNNCTPSSEFAFVGWTESAVQLNGDPVRPAAASLHAAGAYAPTSDITLYSVYSSSVNGCDDFAAGVSGAYKLYNKATSDYAIVTANANRYDKASSGTAEIFYIAYSTAKSAYTIRTSLGYLGWSGASGSETLSKDNATPYYWDIKEGTGANAGYWNFQPTGASTKQFSGNGTYFNLHSNSTKYYIRLEKSAMTYYYNTALCGGAQITFHDGGGEISGTPTTPDGASWNSGTHVLSGLEDCDKITEFPTASYDGWTFVGWSTEDYSNSGKHIADYAEENASTDEPDASIIYKTGGNPYVVRGGSIDLYPVFTRFPENEPFNTESGGDYYIYYLKPGTDDGYGANIRVYAGEYDGEKRYDQTSSCAAATEFTFTKDGDVWHIYDNTTGKYLKGRSANDDLQQAADLSDELDDWTITIKNGNQFDASCQGYGRYLTFSTFANFFMDYSVTANPTICMPVYLGSCTERIYSSEPNPVPTIDLTGEPMVTSSVGQQVRATETMTLSAAHLGSVPANKIIVSGTNLKFATTASATPSTTLSLSLTDGSLAATTIYVYYTPAAGDTEDGLENIVVTAKAYYTTTPKDVQTTGTVHARHLPADFVIAAKWGDKWYALPNTCSGEGSNTAGVQIEVDNNDVPTAATAAPSTAKWGMRQTKAGSRLDGSYNDRLVFTERTTATANDQKTLYNYNQAEVFTNATYTNYNNTNPERYEWIPVTTDFGDYELTNANNADHHLILRNSDGLFVAQNSDKAYDGKVRLLPATFYEEAPVQIIEWKANSVVVMYTGTETSATTKVGANSASSAQTLSTHKLTHGIYELTTGQSLASNDGKNLLLTFGSMKKVFEIPVIITGNSTAYSGHEKQDVVIVNGGKLSAAATKYSYHNIYVYGGGKLKIASGTNLGVNNIILRAGGIATSGIGSTPSATYEYVYPQVELRGTLSSTKTNIKYEYITDYDHWYQLCLPFDGTLSSIHYPQEYYGDNVTAANTGSWVIKRYAGEVRATGNYDAWKDIETEGATSVTAGHGYIFWGAPKKVSVGGAAKQRQQWGIQRITMPITAAAATTAETADKNISVDSYSEVATSDKPNDQGWNLVGNPYMVNLTNLSSESMIAGQLVHTETVPWDGKWRNNGDGIRYVTIPDNHFDSYEAKTASVAAGAGDFMPGRAFFVQIAEGASTLTFAAANRSSLMPALYAKTEQPIDVETGIVLSDETKHDEVNFWIKDGKTAEYEYNADYPKTPNNGNFNLYGVHSHGDLSWIAISPEIAEGSMAIGYQVPTAGEYRLSLSETYVSDKIEQLLVTDHEMSPEITTNLLVEDYLFQVNQAETNNERFTVSIKIKSGTNTATDIDDIRSESDHPKKFLYRDKIYILRGGTIYDSTGKMVREIK